MELCMQNAIFCGSPRENGNSNFAAQLVLKALGNGTIYSVAKASISGCLACDYCASHYGECVLSNKNACAIHSSQLQNTHDQADFYFQKLFSAEHVFFISPIYHYNVPAQMKAFLDRTQAWYYKTKEDTQNQKKCGLILLGARTKGDKLFEGATLTFKYALQSLNYALVEPLCFYGLDGHNDLETREDYHKQIAHYVKNYLNFPLV